MQSQPTFRELLYELKAELSTEIHSTRSDLQDLRGRILRAEDAILRITTQSQSLDDRTEDLDLVRYELKQLRLQIDAGETNRRDLGMEALKTFIGIAIGGAVALIGGAIINR